MRSETELLQALTRTFPAQLQFRRIGALHPARQIVLAAVAFGRRDGSLARARPVALSPVGLVAVVGLRALQRFSFVALRFLSLFRLLVLGDGGVIARLLRRLTTSS
jgi:hypothetical protein